MTFAAHTLAIPDQYLKAWVCVVDAAQQGVVEHRNVSRIWLDDDGLLTVREEPTDALGRPQETYYGLDQVWGAWLDWPHYEFRTKHGMQRRGPTYFLEFTWKPWEWVGHNGARLIRKPSSPIKNSIWCDETNTDADPMTADLIVNARERHCLGWIRKDRVAKQERVLSFHSPFMP